MICLGIVWRAISSNIILLPDDVQQNCEEWTQGQQQGQVEQQNKQRDIVLREVERRVDVVHLISCLSRMLVALLIKG